MGTPCAFLTAVRNAQGVPKSWISARIGGDQIDYADESEAVRSRFTEALSEHNLEHDMDQFYDAEIPDLPPKSAAAAADLGGRSGISAS